MSDDIVKSTLMLTVVKFALQLVKWVSTFVVIRYLQPDDYAVDSLFDTVVVFASVLCGQNLSSSLIQRKQLDDSSVRQHMSVSLTVGLGSALVLLLASPAIADLFDSQALKTVLPLGCLSILIGAVSAVPSNLMQRDLRFRELAIISFVVGLIEVAITLSLAINGWGYYSLILGHLLASFVRLLVYVWLCRYPLLPKFTGLGEIRDDLVFNAYLLGSALCWMAYAKVDIVVGGLTISKPELGFYVVALQIVLMPANKLMPIVRQVSYPVLSRSEADPRPLYFKMVELALLLISPISIGMALTADLWVPIILSERWVPVVPITLVLAALVPLRILFETQNPLLKSMGQGQEVLMNMLIAVSIMSAAVLLGQRYGVMGIAWGVVLAFPLILLGTLRRTARLAELSWRKLASAAGRPLLCALAMCAAVLAARPWFAAVLGWGNIGELIGAVAVGVLSYSLAAYALCRPSIQSVSNRFRRT